MYLNRMSSENISYNLFNINYDVVNVILSYIDIASLGKLCQSCKYLNTIVMQANNIWKDSLNRLFRGYSPFQLVKHDLCRNKLSNWYDRNFSWSFICKSKINSRYLHRASMNGNNGKIYMFGGFSEDDAILNDFHEINIDDRRNFSIHSISPLEIATGMPLEPRSASAMCCAQNHVYIFGGQSSQREFLPSLIRVNPAEASWETVSAPPSPTPHPSPPLLSSSPSGRWGHTLVSYGAFLVLFGGSRYGETFGDLWVFSLLPHQASMWIKVECSGDIESRPQCRGGHSACMLGSYMCIFGGNDTSVTFNDTWMVDLSPLSAWSWSGQQSSAGQGEGKGVSISIPPALAWIPCPPPSRSSWTPSKRIGHCAVALGERYMLVCGGRDVFARPALAPDRVLLFDAHSRVWCNVTPTNMSVHYTGQCYFISPTGIYFFGGLSQSGLSSDLHHLQLFADIREQAEVKVEVPGLVASGATTGSGSAYSCDLS